MTLYMCVCVYEIDKRSLPTFITASEKLHLLQMYDGALYETKKTQGKLKGNAIRVIQFVTLKTLNRSIDRSIDGLCVKVSRIILFSI